MSYVKPAGKRRRRRRGVGASNDNGASVPLGAAMAALLITAFVFGRKMR
jgi:hypothetical protein